MPIRTVVEPAVEPVSGALASLWCRAPSEDGALIDMLIKAARERAENTTQRVFVQRTMEWSGRGFHETDGQWDGPAWLGSEHARAKLSENFCRNGGYGGVVLVAPVQSIVSVTYVDLAGASRTLDPALYVLDVAAEPGILRYTGDSLPRVTADRSDAVRVRFVAGYPPANPESSEPDFRAHMPGALLTWMQIQVSTWYTQRESLETGGRLVETSRNFSEALLDGLIVSSRFV